MAAEIPTSEPTTFAAGDSLSWTRSLSDYTIADGWSLVYYFRGYNLSTLDLTSTTSGTLHLVSITAAQSTTLTPGTYTVGGFAVKSGERVQIYSGQIVVTANLATLEAGADTRSHAKRTLENIEAVIEGRASSSVLNSTVNGTSLQRIPVADLLKLRDYYAQKVLGEERALAAAQGRSTDRRILASFT
jgi:hypothetical protein